MFYALQEKSFNSKIFLVLRPQKSGKLKISVFCLVVELPHGEFVINLLQIYIYIWVEQARKGKGQKIGNFTLYVLGSFDHLYIFNFAGNCHVFEAYRGESYYGI